MLKKQPTLVKPTLEEMLPIYQELLPRHKIKVLVKASKVTLYWRLLTPLIILWGLIIQRLSTDHSCDGVVSHLHTGAADGLDRNDEHEAPLSKRLKSESSSSYVQGRNRLPLMVIKGALKYVASVLGGWLQGEAAEKGKWKGLEVRVLDGTTYRLPPTGDLPKIYGQAPVIGWWSGQWPHFVCTAKA